MNKEEKIVTRFAPSPTGFMHVGNVRAALFAWLWAKKNNGTFILRIEDTDKEREVAGSIEHIIETLQWLGLNWSEGPGVEGKHSPYLQSQRLDIYKKYANLLIEKGFAYPDPYTEEQVEFFRKEAEENKKAFLYREYRPEQFDVWDGTKPLRFKIPILKSYAWHDMVFGDLSAGQEALDDFVLIKSDGYPTYNFAHIVDDIEMNVTIVMRGQEYIPSTPKFLAVYEALGITPPIYAYLPHIMAPGGNKKLGKRDGAKDVLEYRSEGYLPQTIVNFLALLGWNPGGEKEIFTVDELVQLFTLERIQVSGAQMNLEKLDWMNKEHLAKLSDDEFKTYINSFMSEKYTTIPNYSDVIVRLLPVFRERIVKGSDLSTMDEAGELGYFFQEPTINPTILIWKGLVDDVEKQSKTKQYLNNIVNILEKYDGEVVKEKVKEIVFPYAENNGKGEVLWPLRVSLSGREKSPDPFTLVEVLGLSESIKRIQSAVKLL